LVNPDACHFVLLRNLHTHVSRGSPARPLPCRIQGFEAFVSIDTGKILEGHLPVKAARIVAEWVNEPRAELLENWTKARKLEPLQRIPGADND